MLTLNPITWRIWRVPKNANRWKMGFNLAFKGLSNVKNGDFFLHMNILCPVRNSPFFSPLLRNITP